MQQYIELAIAFAFSTVFTVLYLLRRQIPVGGFAFTGWLVTAALWLLASGTAIDGVRTNTSYVGFLFVGVAIVMLLYLVSDVLATWRT